MITEITLAGFIFSVSIFAYESNVGKGRWNYRKGLDVRHDDNVAMKPGRTLFVLTLSLCEPMKLMLPFYVFLCF